jgi:hypothetical protein
MACSVASLTEHDQFATHTLSLSCCSKAYGYSGVVAGFTAAIIALGYRSSNQRVQEYALGRITEVSSAHLSAFHRSCGCEVPCAGSSPRFLSTRKSCSNVVYEARENKSSLLGESALREKRAVSSVPHIFDSMC